MAKLAINGGNKIREKLFPAYHVLGEEEAQIAYDVVKSGVLSKFLGSWNPDFFGGPQVQSFEKEWAKHYGVKHAISVNSNTSGIICSLGALGIGPGDEVIVSPYSMSISAAAPLFYGAIPVFADIEPDYFCLDPKDVERKITEKTRAIIVVDILGHLHDVEAFKQISKKYNIPIIEDTAQAPDSAYNGKLAGTFCDLGVYSLNYHKHIHTGEGGVIVTDNDDLATRCQLIRNHAEAVVDNMKYEGSLINMIGFNMRLPEIESAIGKSLLKKLPNLIRQRRENISYIELALKDLSFLKMPKVRENCTHSYYAHGLIFNKEMIGVSRDKFVQAVKAELPATELRNDDGVLMGCGYVKPLYLQSLYQKRIGFGKANYPFQDPANKTAMNYEKGLCPVAEQMHFEKLITHELMRPGMKKEDLDDVIAAFFKVTENIDEIS
jgi:dTDP-4-amino-4,6-dideoxygalactose transaminase